MIHGECSFIMLYIIELQHLEMLLSASMSRWITSSVSPIRHAFPLSFSPLPPLSPAFPSPSLSFLLFSLLSFSFLLLLLLLLQLDVFGGILDAFDDINYFLVLNTHY